MMKILKYLIRGDEKLGWDNVPIGKYIAAEKEVKRVCDDEMERALAILKILKGVDYSNVPLNEYLVAVKELDFLGTDIPKINIPDSIDINGKKYRVVKGLDKITTAQFIDFNNYLKMEDDNKIIYLLSCFLIPDGASGYNNGYDFDKTIEDIKEMPVIMAHNLSFFFKRQSDKLWKNTRNYLVFQILRMKLPLKKRLKLVASLAGVCQNMESYHIF